MDWPPIWVFVGGYKRKVARQKERGVEGKDGQGSNRRSKYGPEQGQLGVNARKCKVGWTSVDIIHTRLPVLFEERFAIGQES